MNVLFLFSLFKHYGYDLQNKNKKTERRELKCVTVNKTPKKSVEKNRRRAFRTL